MLQARLRVRAPNLYAEGRDLALATISDLHHRGTEGAETDERRVRIKSGTLRPSALSAPLR